MWVPRGSVSTRPVHGFAVKPRNGSGRRPCGVASGVVGRRGCAWISLCSFLSMVHAQEPWTTFESMHGVRRGSPGVPSSLLESSSLLCVRALCRLGRLHQGGTMARISWPLGHLAHPHMGGHRRDRGRGRGPRMCTATAVSLPTATATMLTMLIASGARRGLALTKRAFHGATFV